MANQIVAERAKTQAEIWTERAKIAREQRKTAPPIDVRGFANVQQKVLIEKFAKEHGGQDAAKGFHFMFGDRKLGDAYADKGYEPVVLNGAHVHFEGDPLWKIPTHDYQQDLDAVRARSDFLLKTNVKKDESDAKTNPTSTGEETERRKISAAELASVPAGGEPSATA